MSKHDGGSAFPEVYTETHGEWGDYRSEVTSTSGMSLRDFFAAKAMQAIVSNNERTGPEFGYADVDIISRRAYQQADAMLRAREAA